MRVSRGGGSTVCHAHCTTTDASGSVHGEMGGQTPEHHIRVNVQGLLEIEDTHHPQGGPMLLELALP
jgi:hypothetical protein